MSAKSYLRVSVAATAAISIALAFCLPAASAQAPEKLTVERLHAQPALGGPSLRGAQISPDGSQVTILQGREDDARQLDLWRYDLASGEGRILVRSTDLLTEEVDLSEEEKNRRERQRIYDNGITSYQWDEAGEALLFPLGGDVYLYDLEKKSSVQVTKTPSFETDPKISPKGGFVSFVRDDEVVVFDRLTGKERKLTKGAGDYIRNGVSEFVAQEELDRDTGYWWSPNDQHIAYLQIDESSLAIAERLDFSATGTKTIRQRYPFAGTDNVKIKVGIVKAKGGRTTWVDLGTSEDIYIGDVYWSHDSSVLYLTRLSRDQKMIELLQVNPASGGSKVILTEKSDTWINLNKSFRALSDGGFIWGSERDGYHQLYLYNAKGKLQKNLTQGLTQVNKLSCFQEEKAALYITGWQRSALERHIFKIDLNNISAPAKRLSTGEGRHSASFAENCTAYIDTYSDVNQPMQVSVYDADGSLKISLLENKLDENHPYAPYLSSHEKWSFGQLKAEDGTALDYQILKPTDIKPGEKRPAIILVYGGPHAQLVHKGWRGGFEQLLVDQGYIVFRLDNRGAANRGTNFENPLYRAMGQVEVRDQAVGAKWLAAQADVDPDQIGVYGWSYGGYMALMMLSQNPELYKAGVAGAPVTDWTLYDTAYTERYMGHPVIDKAAYDKSSVFEYLDNLRGEGELLLIHGMADDNVVFLNSIQLMDALQKSGKTYELMTYPGEKHGFRSPENKLHRDKLILDFFSRKLN